VHRDASHTGEDGVLVQKISDGDEVPMLCMSRELNKCNCNRDRERMCDSHTKHSEIWSIHRGHPFSVIAYHAH